MSEDTKPDPKKMGRPEKPIDWKLVEQLCHIQCTHEEIASFCQVVKDTLYDRAAKHYGETFSTIYKRFSEGGRSSLRRNQFRMSEKNCSMAIWLGKQYLGQREPEPTKEVVPNDKVISDFLTLAKAPENQVNDTEPQATPELPTS